MKAIRNDLDELRLESRPWGTGLIVSGLTLMVAAIGLQKLLEGDGGGLWVLLAGGGACGLCFWAFVRLDELRLSRADGVAQLRQTTVAGRTEVAVALADVERALVEEVRGSKGRRLTRAALALRGAPALPLSGSFASGPAAHATAAAINAWLAGGHRGGPAA